MPQSYNISGRISLDKIMPPIWNEHFVCHNDHKILNQNENVHSTQIYHNLKIKWECSHLLKQVIIISLISLTHIS